MDRATKAIKRGSIRLKSYSELNLIVSDLNDLRSYGKTSVKAHQTLVEDLIKWTHQESNERFKISFTFLNELNAMWTDIHNELFENLKNFRKHFELILESEQAVEKARNHLSNCEQNVAKLDKEMKKSIERYSRFHEETMKIDTKLKDAQRALDMAKVEVTQKEEENSIIKLIRIKEGLKQLTDSYLKLSHKCNVVMHAQKTVVNELPDDKETTQEAKFASECKIKQAITKAKTMIQTMGGITDSTDSNVPMEYEAPPPYSPYYGPSCSSRTSSSPASCVSPARIEPTVNLATLWQQGNHGRRLIDHSGCSDQPTLYVCSRCTAQMISDHKYFSGHETEAELANTLRNTRIS